MERPRLLVVDDDPYTRTGLKTLFSVEGWLVVTAGTVAEALALLDPAPQCVILDLRLPDGGGEAVLREIRARSLRTRVAICSGVDDPKRLATVRGLNPELMLWKPIELAPVFRLCASARAASA
jgi:two-component system response regulator PilR (NtrC family)